MGKRKQDILSSNKGEFRVQKTITQKTPLSALTFNINVFALRHLYVK